LPPVPIRKAEEYSKIVLTCNKQQPQIHIHLLQHQTLILLIVCARCYADVLFALL